MVPAEGVRTYLLNGIAGTPAVLQGLVGDRPSSDPVWDRRPDPQRFTLREMVAHLADWDDVFLSRVTRMKTLDSPFLESVDEGAVCAERRYSAQDPQANMARLAASRPQLVAEFQAVNGQDWLRTAHRELVGDVTLFDLAVMVLGHDAYHLKQASEFSR